MEVISVRFRSSTKDYFFDPKGIAVQPGDDVIVETAQGAEFARCSQGNRDVDERLLVLPLRPLIRIATDHDRRTFKSNQAREKEAMGICRKKIAEHGLDMKLVRVESNFDGSKILFYFTSEGRVDFRELVRDLAGTFRARIELRQIGVRDEAKMLGGVGICGNPYCCSRFLDDFIPVSIKMAKTQNLSLNPTKISGSCGRLMCCLKYEQNSYEDAMHHCPKNDSFVLTPDGPGNISAVDILRERVTVRLDNMPETPKHYHVSELIVLRNGKGSRDGIEIPDERPARYHDEKEEAEIPFSSSYAAPQSAEITPEKPKRENNRPRGQRAQKGENNVQKSVEQAAVQSEGKDGEVKKHRRAHHRGGRNHRRGNGNAPKAE